MKKQNNCPVLVTPISQSCCGNVTIETDFGYNDFYWYENGKKAGEIISRNRNTITISRISNNRFIITSILSQ